MPNAPRLPCPRSGCPGLRDPEQRICSRCQGLNLPKRPCPRLLCPNFVTYPDRVCGPHKAEEQGELDTQRGSASSRGYGITWRRLRILILHRDPVCKVCDRRASWEVDHIKPLRLGGTNRWWNLQGLCKPCHSRKTLREQAAIRREKKGRGG